MSKKSHKTGLAPSIALLTALAYSTSATALPYNVGDVFASIGDGKVNVYSQTGGFIQTLDTGLGGYTTGSTFDSAGNFYVTAFSANRVSQFDNNGMLVNANWATGISSPESIVFDAAGSAYIGNAGAAQIQKVDANGAPIVNYTTLQNTDWIDLAADQQTLLYSNEGSVIRELNTTTNVDTVFTSGSYGALYAKRYLPSGGVLAASSSGNAYRWDAAGTLQQTYAIGIGSVFALNLDPNGTSFWTGSTGGQQLSKINLTTGATEETWSTGTGQLFGLAVYGEIQAGGGGSGGNGRVPESNSLILLALGLFGLVLARRQQSLPL